MKIVTCAHCYRAGLYDGRRSRCNHCGKSLKKEDDFSKILQRSLKDSQINRIKCPGCKKNVDGKYGYCGYCGIRLKPTQVKPYKPISKQRRCPTCKQIQVVESGQSYCTICGHHFVSSFDTIDPRLPKKSIISSQQQSNNNCFIATACEADLETLKTFYELRDRILLPSQTGKKFVQLYYRYAPSIASIIKTSSLLQKAILLGFLRPLAAVLRNTFSTRKSWNRSDLE